MKEKFLVFALCLFSLPLLAGDWIECNPNNLNTDYTYNNYVYVKHGQDDSMLKVRWELRYELKEIIAKAKNEGTQVLIKLNEDYVDSSKTLREVMCAKLIALQEDDIRSFSVANIQLTHSKWKTLWKLKIKAKTNLEFKISEQNKKQFELVLFAAREDNKKIRVNITAFTRSQDKPLDAPFDLKGIFEIAEEEGFIEQVVTEATEKLGLQSSIQ